MDSVTCSESHEEDIISEFPDEILLHILSYLPTKDKVTTLALLTRWKSLRSLLPRILYFDFHAHYDSIRWDESHYLNLYGTLHHGSFNHGLVYDQISLDSFHDMVQSIPVSSRIAKFRFRCPLLLVNQSRLQSLLSHAARHRIEEMDFDSDIDTHDDYEAAMSLPHSLLNSDSLTSLNLTMQSTKIEFPTSIWLPRLQTLKFTAQSSEFEFPTSVWLPSLKTLHIEWFQDWDDLILPTCCPVLEELILRCRSHYLYIPIDSASFQRLTIESFMSNNSFSSFHSCSSFEVNCSNLQSLNIYSIGPVNIQVCDLYSLAEAEIDMDCKAYLIWGFRQSPLGQIILGLLESIRHVKSLKLSSSTVEGIQFLLSHKKIEVDKLSIFYNLTLLEGIQFLLGLKKIEVDKLPIFYNLTHLELAVRGGRGGVILLVCILQKSPHLQSLKSRIVYPDYEDMEQYCLKDVVLPSCLEHCLNTFSISSLKGTSEEEIDFLKYIIENAKVLEHFTVHWRCYGKSVFVEERMSVQQDLSKLFRSDCLYEFF